MSDTGEPHTPVSKMFRILAGRWKRLVALRDNLIVLWLIFLTVAVFILALQSRGGAPVVVMFVAAAIVTVIFVVIWLVFNAMNLQTSTKAEWEVFFDDDSIRSFGPEGIRQEIGWQEIREVIIESTDDGPAVEDVFWVLVPRSEGAQPMVIPNGAKEFAALLAALQSRLSGFDNEVVAKAMGSAENATFVVWRAPDAPASTPS